MAHTITSNKKNTSAVIHFTGSNSSLIVAGNSTTSNIAISNEVLTGAYIAQAVWGCDPNGYIVVKRGANSVAFYDSTGQHEYAGCGMPITIDQNANLQVQFVGSSNAFVIMEIQKVGNFISEYIQN